jgi:hypothetical protein
MADQTNTGAKIKAPVTFEMDNAERTQDEEAFDYQLETGVPEAREGSEVDVGLNNSQQDGSRDRGSAHNIIDLAGGQIVPGESGGGMSSSLLNVTPDAESSTEKRRKSAKRLNNSALNES